jgi:hypothetical protein
MVITLSLATTHVVSVDVASTATKMVQFAVSYVQLTARLRPGNPSITRLCLTDGLSQCTNALSPIMPRNSLGALLSFSPWRSQSIPLCSLQESFLIPSMTEHPTRSLKTSRARERRRNPEPLPRSFSSSLLSSHSLVSSLFFLLSSPLSQLVGRNGVEPSTLRLSTVRSNQLSYLPSSPHGRRERLLEHSSTSTTISTRIC